MTVSIIVYGRNDQVGYNAHKRVALSLNAMAEVLTDPNDEILFTDYNSGDSHPTQLEAIQDTLTTKAKKLIRIFRVRPYVHNRIAHLTHSSVNEPLARNVALRRSNPDNKWILSTNTDMIFVSQEKNLSLSEIIADIKEDAYYAISRFEIPETLWESLDRLNPVKAIEEIKRLGKQFHLNEINLTHKYNYYDAPGDFQLAPRKHYFELGGFHEDMILGWHVDSNFSRRHALKYGLPKSLQDKVHGYHTSHTKIAGWMHSPKKVKLGNDYNLYCESVASPYIEKQQDTWGLVNEDIEEIRLSDNSNYTMLFPKELEKLMVQPQKECLVVDLQQQQRSNNITPIDIQHTLPYIIEQIVHQKPGAQILYLGINLRLLEQLIEFTKINKKNFILSYLELFHLSEYFIRDKGNKDLQIQANKIEINFNGPIQNDTLNQKINQILEHIKQHRIDSIIFDCSIDKKHYEQIHLNPQINLITKKWIKIFENFLEVLSKPNNHLLHLKVICIGAHANRFSFACTQFLNCTSSPITTRVIHGYPLPQNTSDIVVSKGWIKLRRLKQLLKSMVRHFKDIVNA